MAEYHSSEEMRRANEYHPEHREGRDSDNGGYTRRNRNGGNGNGGFSGGKRRNFLPRELPELDGSDIAQNAEIVMNWIKEGSPHGQIELTTSKIRSILTMVNEIYNKAIFKDEELPEELVNEIAYLKVRIVYECGREDQKHKNLLVNGTTIRVGPVEEFVRGARLLEKLDKVGNSRKAFLDFARYLEALVAYHRYLGGRDTK